MESVLETAIFEMGRKARGHDFCPSDVVKWIFPTAWIHFITDIEEVMMKLYREDKIAVTQYGEEIPKDHLPQGKVRIRVL